jgi:hypothetical protein
VLRDGMRRRGFALRRGDTFPGLGPSWLRIAAREPAMTDLLVAALALELADIHRGSQQDHVEQLPTSPALTRAGHLGLGTKTPAGLGSP